MRMGVHKAALPLSLTAADQVFLFEPANSGWSLADVAAACGSKAQVSSDITALVDLIVESASQDTSIVIMSNGGFGGIHDKLLDALKKKWEH
jgi:UDP-N-acetylmuramate: L-alanyl-gamma-D-glutamyl-meso-diaminopimelate ligase